MKRFKNFSLNVPSIYLYEGERYAKEHEIAINKAVNHFKEVYSKYGDKRLLTTKKKPQVDIKCGRMFISMNFNGKHYGQAYIINNYTDFSLPIINR